MHNVRAQPAHLSLFSDHHPRRSPPPPASAPSGEPPRHRSQPAAMKTVLQLHGGCAMNRAWERSANPSTIVPTTWAWFLRHQGVPVTELSWPSCRLQRSAIRSMGVIPASQLPLLPRPSVAAPATLPWPCNRRLRCRAAMKQPQSVAGRKVGFSPLPSHIASRCHANAFPTSR